VNVRARVILPFGLLLAAGAAGAAETAKSPVTSANASEAAQGPADTEPRDRQIGASYRTTYVQHPSGPPGWLTPLISGISGVLGAVVGGYFATRNAKGAVVQKTNELEIESIDRRLGEFVAPFEQLSMENLVLARELKRRHGGDGFRTLPALLERGWKERLTTGDRALVDAVVSNGRRLRKMILAHGGAVSPAIRLHLAAASTHFRMLDLAYEGSLDPDPERYASYVYPRELDGALALERRRLETRKEELRSSPDKTHVAIPELVLPPEFALLEPKALNVV
jgi:hypothetical protein